MNVTDNTREVIDESNQQKTIRITDNPIERRTDAETERKTKKESTVKPGDKIFYKMSDTEKEWVVAMVISRGGKKSGSISNY